jgi:hypothetical protein
MRDPLNEEAAHMGFCEGDYEIQTFAPDCPDDPFANRISLRRLRWRFQYLQPQVLYMLIEILGEARAAVMNEQSVGMVRGNRFTQLL